MWRASRILWSCKGHFPIIYEQELESLVSQWHEGHALVTLILKPEIDFIESLNWKVARGTSIAPQKWFSSFRMVLFLQWRTFVLRWPRERTFDIDGPWIPWVSRFSMIIHLYSPDKDNSGKLCPLCYHLNLQNVDREDREDRQDRKDKVDI